MKKIIYGLLMGFFCVGIICIIPQLMGKIFSSGNSNIWDVIELNTFLLILSGMFIFGFFIGILDYNRKERKREEEERRQAEQDRNNELMRQYLERKLQEENEVNN